ncbi:MULTISPECIES: glyoxalase [unclassified Flavobacterium]|uniref:glyoxalase n=1 Tax=unclassified Flavobacterium TaxID=196869 RepID=UPI001F12D945|nr:MULTISPECIES: glyoxalase [unclassified Flavobacterium]UMY64440.1 glyoxalase [Flavobacterium sp. HJ-32-4]
MELPSTAKPLTGVQSLRPFLGAKDFETSRRFYRTIGFTETLLWDGFALFSTPSGFSFYLQNAYVKDWIDNTQVFMEVANTEAIHDALAALDLPAQFQGVRLTPVQHAHWGRECFLHDPSGILWHFGTFITP